MSDDDDVKTKKDNLLSVCVAYRDDLEKELGSDDSFFEKFDEMFNGAEKILGELGAKGALPTETDAANIEFRIDGLISDLTRVYDQLVKQKIEERVNNEAKKPLPLAEDASEQQKNNYVRYQRNYEKKCAEIHDFEMSKSKEFTSFFKSVIEEPSLRLSQKWHYLQALSEETRHLVTEVGEKEVLISESGGRSIEKKVVLSPEKIGELRGVFARNSELVEDFANKQLARRMVNVLEGKELSFLEQHVVYNKAPVSDAPKTDDEKVKNFETLLNQPHTTAMLSTRKDSAAKTFLKALATITVVPALIWSVVHRAKTGSYNFFQSNSQVTQQKINENVKENKNTGPKGP